MDRCVLKSKIHRASVTEANLNYEGSITLGPDLMDAADFLPYERVQVLNLNNGQRFETYVIRGDSSGVVILNGPAARLGEVGDKVIILSYAWAEEEEAAQNTPVVVYVDEENRVVEVKGSESCRTIPGVGG